MVSSLSVLAACSSSVGRSLALNPVGISVAVDDLGLEVVDLGKASDGSRDPVDVGSAALIATSSIDVGIAAIVAKIVALIDSIVVTFRFGASISKLYGTVYESFSFDFPYINSKVCRSSQ